MATSVTPTFTTTIGVGGATAAASGAGITFPATQSASSDANTLDDYEEGTWTPTTSTSGYTVSSSSGTYTKIGRMVHLQITVQFSAVNGSSNSAVMIAGLPFTVAVANAGVVRDNTSTGAIYMLYARPSEATIEINSMDSVASGSNRTIRISENYSGTVIYTV
jgi:hypothetical protein